MTSSKVGILNLPSNRVGRSSGSGCTARSVLISFSVKSEAKNPSSAKPSTIFVVRRPGNLDATSVVEIMFGSWRAIRWPSLVATRSGSM